MKKVLGIIALAACFACTEKPKEISHPALEDVDIWGCIDQLEYTYTLLNESGEDFPAIKRYAWADIDGDGLAELFLASEKDVFPEIYAAFALGGEEPAVLGFEDASHMMTFYPEGVSTSGTGVVRYNYMDQRIRLKDSKVQWELCIEETKEVYLETEGDCGGITLSRPGAYEVEYPEEEDAQALLAQFTESYELEPDWQPLDSLYEMERFQAPTADINFNKNRFEMVENQVLGDDFTMKFQNRKNADEWIQFTGFYDDGLDVLQENSNAELIAEFLKATCEDRSINVTEDEDYTVYNSYITSLEYYHPENGYAFRYEADHKGTPVYGAIVASPKGSGSVLVMQAESPSERACDRFVEQYDSLFFER